MGNRINKVHQYVIKETERLIKENLLEDNGCDAFSISQSLKIDRANVSRELNNLWKQGQLIKIQGRPILFLDYNILKNEYPFQYIPLTIPLDKSLSTYLNQQAVIKEEKKQESALTKIIGATSGSLSSTVNNVIAAVSYKPNSLPILIIGNKGVRKRRFVNAIYEYTIENDIKPIESKLTIINCSEYSDNEEKFLNKLYGQANNKGAIELANEGIVYLQNIHALSDNLISTVSDCINFGYYYRQQDNKKRKLLVSIVASINNECSKEKEDYLKSIFPVVAYIPSFDKRNLYEKIEMILNLFTEEAQDIGKNIILSKSIVSLFIQHKYTENEREIKNLIRFTCAKCLLRNVKNELNAITIEIDDLPNEILSDCFNEEDSTKYLRALSLYKNNSIICEKNGHCDCFQFFSNIQESYANKNLKDFISEFSLTNDNCENMDSFIENCLETITKCDEIHYNEIRRNINSEVRMAFLKILYNDRYYDLIVNQTKMLYAAMLVISNYLKDNTLTSDYHGIILKEKESIDSQKICDYLQITSPTIHCFIALYLSKAKQLISNTKVSLLIVCHGEKLASYYKEIVEEKAKEYKVRVEAINYKSTLQYNDVLELISYKLKEMETDGGTVVLVDGYPLNDIESFIQKESQTKCKVYSNLTYDLLFTALECCKDSYTLDSFTTSFKPNNPTYNIPDEKDDFVNKLIDNAFSKTLTHINPKKAVDVLLISLNQILDELKIIKTSEIIVKYLSHGVHMLERIIKNNPLEYYQLKQFTHNYHNLMDIIAESLTAAENTFDIVIPTSEIAYLAEIFLDGFGQ